MTRRERNSGSTRGGKGYSPIRRPAVLTDEGKGLRLQKFLATAGVDSRRNCEAFVRDGRVTVDGKVIKDPARNVLPDEHDIRLDGEKLLPPSFKYYLVNKPKGVVCTHRDPAGRPRAIDLVPVSEHRLFPVGRLDENTEGLLLITNDGALAEHLAHPRYEVTRKYRVQVAGLPTPATLAELRKGMHFSDGFFHFHTIRILKRRGRSTFLELELREGKNREIRRLMARAGHKVINLLRVAFGPLRIGRLEVGAFRELRRPELRELYDFVEKTPRKSGRGRGPRKPGPGRKPSGSRSSGSKPTGKGPAKKTRGEKPQSRKKAAKKKPARK